MMADVRGFQLKIDLILHIAIAASKKEGFSFIHVFILSFFSKFLEIIWNLFNFQRDELSGMKGYAYSIQNVTLVGLEPSASNTFINPQAAVYYSQIQKGNFYQAFLCTCGNFGLFAYSCDVYYYSRFYFLLFSFKNLNFPNQLQKIVMLVVGLFFPCCFCCCGCCFICSFCMFVCIPNTICGMFSGLLCPKKNSKRSPKNSSKLKSFLNILWTNFVVNPQYHANLYILFSALCLMLTCGLDLNISILSLIYGIQVLVHWLAYIGNHYLLLKKKFQEKLKISNFFSNRAFPCICEHWFLFLPF